MLYHPQSGYYRQFLSATTKQRQKKVEQIVNQHMAAKSMPSVNPGSVGVWVSFQSVLTHEWQSFLE